MVSFKLASTSRAPASSPSPMYIADSSLTPAPLFGNGTENAQDWLAYFIRYVAFKQIPKPASLAIFALLMCGAVNTWFSALNNDDRGDYRTVLDGLRTMYAPAPISLWCRATEFWSRDQRPTETVEKFCSDMMRCASKVNAEGDMTWYALTQ